MILEIIAGSLDDVKQISESNADRIELCANLQEGGLTPSYELIKLATQISKKPINVMVRPHSNGFCYSDIDFKTIIETIKFINTTNANGIVKCNEF